MEFRRLTRDEIRLIAELDRSEIIEEVYYFKNGALQLKKEFWSVPKWSSEEKRTYSANLTRIFDEGGIILGAFHGSNITGIAALESKFLGKNSDKLNLAGLWVNSQHRKMGIGVALVELVKGKTKELGAKKLYVSATPSQNTIDFYLKQGFRLAKEVDPHLLALEPEDIHMELEL
ncbi:MAG: GNAT family N-acetyltransferase [Candidatus Thorarchaeota archaeon]